MLSVGESLKAFPGDSLEVESKDIFMCNTPFSEPPTLPVASVMGAAKVPLGCREQPFDEGANDVAVSVSSFDQAFDLFL